METIPKPRTLARLLVHLGLADTMSYARRVIEGGGVVLGGKCVTDPFMAVDPEQLNGVEVRCGLRKRATVSWAEE